MLGSVDIDVVEAAQQVGQVGCGEGDVAGQGVGRVEGAAAIEERVRHGAVLSGWSLVDVRRRDIVDVSHRDEVAQIGQTGIEGESPLSRGHRGHWRHFVCAAQIRLVGAGRREGGDLSPNLAAGILRGVDNDVVVAVQQIGHVGVGEGEGAADGMGRVEETGAVVDLVCQGAVFARQAAMDDGERDVLDILHADAEVERRLARILLEDEHRLAGGRRGHRWHHVLAVQQRCEGLISRPGLDLPTDLTVGVLGGVDVDVVEAGDQVQQVRRSQVQVPGDRVVGVEEAAAIKDRVRHRAVLAGRGPVDMRHGDIVDVGHADQEAEMHQGIVQGEGPQARRIGGYRRHLVRAAQPGFV